ncbi:MAG: biopolymer transporter ExbD, partial [Rickettsiales bacterium]|nr:biopolymer transporter ExbD [Rickettsiales bacterium]
MGASLGNNGGSRRRRNGANRFSEINITPMVDVMLVLLIIFMVAAPMMTTGVSVDLPKTNAS